MAFCLCWFRLISKKVKLFIKAKNKIKPNLHFIRIHVSVCLFFTQKKKQKNKNDKLPIALFASCVL